MATFNKSQIFKSAWSIVRAAGKSFSEALRAAWAIAKNADKNILSAVTGKFGVVLPDSVYETGTPVGKVWEANGKARLYVKVYFKNESPADCGYIDLVTGKSYLSSRPVGVARRLESMTQIVAK